MAKTYTLAGIGVTFGNGKHMLSIFNGAGSGRIIRVYRAWMLNNQTAGVTGVLTTMAMRRTSSQSGGTSITPTKHDTNSENVPAQVLFAAGATVSNTADVELRRWVWSNDEPAASSATSDELECLIPLNVIWDTPPGTDVEPLVLREGQGVTLHHSGSSAVGVADLFIEFTSENT